MKLFPQVQQIIYHQGAFDLSQPLLANNKNTTPSNIKALEAFLPVNQSKDGGHFKWVIDHTYPEEGYKLEITAHTINIISSTNRGQLWAIKTLKQIVKQSKQYLPCLEIKDAPALKIRGFMLDISRGKIPKLKTLFDYIDMLSDLKMNHFELYVEGFSYHYPSFDPAYFEHTDALSIADYKRLDRYAKTQGVDFVPCHNTFGHMTEWLKKDAFRELAIMKDGMQMWGGHRLASTLNPLKQESIHFVKKLLDDALLGSTSDQFNICFDEAYELGQGPTKEMCDQVGIEAVFQDYLHQVYTHLKGQKKTVMMWGDFFNDHPEALKKIPKDIIVIDWGYDHDYPFDRRLKRLAEYQIPFISSPGTSSWNSISGRTYDMLVNIEKAILYTKKYQGLGTLLTDWGDNGHIQYPLVSYPAIIYTALESWSDHTGNLELTKNYLNQFIYQDENQVLGNLSLDIGTYYRHQHQYSSNGTQLFRVLLKAAELKHKPITDFIEATKNITYSTDKLKRILIEYETYLKALKEVQTNKDIRAEIMAFRQTIYHVLLACHLLLAARLKNNNQPYQQSAKFLLTKIDGIISGHKKTWLQKNRQSGLYISINMFTDIKTFIENNFT